MGEIRLRGDLAANWAIRNPVLDAREPAVETDTGKFKIGDGVTAWLDLDYSSGPAGPKGDKGDDGTGTGTVTQVSDQDPDDDGHVDLDGVYPRVVTPQDHGAAADGTTDDTTAVQAACTAVQDAGGGIVYLPAGTYKTTDTISVPFPCIVRGAGRETTTINYTGSDTAIEMWDRDTAEQKTDVTLSDFTLTASSASTGIDAKGMIRGQIQRVKVEGASTPVTGSIGVLWDGSYGGSIGCWWNVIRDSWITGWDTCVKSTGSINAGQANENKVVGTRLEDYNKGYWIHIGDHNTAEHCDMTSTVDDCVGVYIEDSQARVVDCRYERTHIAVELASSGAKDAEMVCNTISSSVDVGYQFDSTTTALAARIIGGFNNATTPVSDSSSTQSDGTDMHYFGNGALIPVAFYSSGLTADVSDSTLDVAGASGNVRLPVFRAYQIRGITVRMSDAPTAGSVTVTPTVGGTASTTLSVELDVGDKLGGKYQPMGNDVNAQDSTNSVGAVVTTSSDLSPTDMDVLVVVWVELTP